MSDDTQDRTVEVIELIVRSLATEPDEVRLEVDDDDDRELTVRVFADQSDMGRIIGKRGRVIQAVRQVARAAASLDGKRATVDVVD